MGRYGTEAGADKVIKQDISLNENNNNINVWLILDSFTKRCNGVTLKQHILRLLKRYVGNHRNNTIYVRHTEVTE